MPDLASRSEARPWRPEISATALQIIVADHTLVETCRSRGADVTFAKTTARVRTGGAAWLVQRRSGWEVLAVKAVCRQKRGGGRLAGTKVLPQETVVGVVLFSCSSQNVPPEPLRW